jgi:hypothetical protein
MRTIRTVLALALPLGGMLMPLAASGEEYRGTYEQQMACTPDVWRLCSSAIPDVNRITACLRQNTPSLSDGCRAVFEAENSVPQPAPRGRVLPAPPPRYRAAPPPRPYYDDDED